MKTIKISRLSSGKVLTLIDGEKTDLEFYAGTTNTETILLEALERVGITVETEVSWLKVMWSNSSGFAVYLKYFPPDFKIPSRLFYWKY